MRFGQTVYTVNEKTNEVEEWEYVNVFYTVFGKLAHLRNGEKFCFTSLNRLYETYLDAWASTKIEHIFLN